jgi:hypothetical protein
MSADEVAKAFTAHYYQQFDTVGADALAGLYGATSTLTFEGATVTGAAAIVEKLKSIGKVRRSILPHQEHVRTHSPFPPSLPPSQLSHKVVRIDVQPSVNPNAILIFVVGHIILEGQTNQMHYAQVFQLVASAPSVYCIHNDIFSLNYA